MDTFNTVSIPIFHIDAFASEPFRGNPAGVCLLPSMTKEDWMLKVASEINLSETAFVVREGHKFRLRWFTPNTEVDLCGHATLATAHVLWSEGLLSSGDPAVFETLSGTLIARKDGEWIVLDFPAEPAESCDHPEGLLPALGISCSLIAKNRMDYLVLAGSEEVVRNMNPDVDALASIKTRGIIVTAPSKENGFDFVSRFFAPAIGIDEDSVTGSAHCCLAPFWSDRLGKFRTTARQISQRGGILRTEVFGDRVMIAGKAITVLKGEWMV